LATPATETVRREAYHDTSSWESGRPISISIRWAPCSFVLSATSTFLSEQTSHIGHQPNELTEKDIRAEKDMALGK
jgi:hypothetical protein